MPFTLSHAAAALPLRRRPLVPAALVAGTLVPDLTLFTKLGGRYYVTHSLHGVVTWDLGLALVALAIWYGVLREPLLALAPVWVVSRVPPKRRWAAGDLIWVPVSAVVGAGTHVLWDSFTHSRSVGAWGWEWLARPVTGATRLLTMVQVLQYVSSVGGLAVLAWWAARQPVVSAGPERPLPERSRRVVFGAALVAGCGFALVYALRAGTPGPRALSYEAVVGAVTGTVFVLSAYATHWQVRAFMERTRRARVG